MRVTQVKKLTRLEQFFYWIEERHAIYLRRQRGEEKPWTDDKVLQSYFFTNPYREHDRVTVWVREHIREPYAHHPNLWFMLCIARQLNRPETLQEMMDTGVWPTGNRWEKDRAYKVLQVIKDRGEPVYTGAYMVRAESHKSAPWYSWSKQEYMTKICLGRVWDARKEILEILDNNPTIEGCCKWLQKFIGWGGFMAYEVVSDWRHTPLLAGAPDIYTWANPGPGAQRGLNRLHKRDLRYRQPETLWVEEMMELMDLCQDSFDPTVFPLFEMRDVEHSLCEYDKYLRMLYKSGRSKRRYNGLP